MPNWTESETKLPPIRCNPMSLHHNERIPGVKEIEAGISSVLAGRYTSYQTAKARTDSHNSSWSPHDTPSRRTADSPTASVHPISCPCKASPTPACVYKSTHRILDTTIESIRDDQSKPELQTDIYQNSSPCYSPFLKWEATCVVKNTKNYPLIERSDREAKHGRDSWTIDNEQSILVSTAPVAAATDTINDSTSLSPVTSTAEHLNVSSFLAAGVNKLELDRSSGSIDNANYHRLPAIVPEDNQWQVEALTKKRRRGRRVEYLVKWLGYPDEESS